MVRFWNTVVARLWRKTDLDSVPVPGHVVITSGSGMVIAMALSIAGFCSVPTFDVSTIKLLAAIEAAYITIVSALLWLVAATWDERHSNAAAAVFTASAGFFASAAFNLPGEAPALFKRCDDVRIWLGYIMGFLPLMILTGGFFRRWTKQQSRACKCAHANQPQQHPNF